MGKGQWGFLSSPLEAQVKREWSCKEACVLFGCRERKGNSGGAKRKNSRTELFGYFIHLLPSLSPLLQPKFASKLKWAKEGNQQPHFPFFSLTLKHQSQLQTKKELMSASLSSSTMFDFIFQPLWSLFLSCQSNCRRPKKKNHCKHQPDLKCKKDPSKNNPHNNRVIY